MRRSHSGDPLVIDPDNMVLSSPIRFCRGMEANLTACSLTFRGSGSQPNLMIAYSSGKWKST